MEDNDSKIYLDQQGNYRDKTPENLAAYPPAEDAAPEEAEVTGDGTGDALPEAGDTELVGEPGPDVPDAEGTPVAKTRKQS